MYTYSVNVVSDNSLLGLNGIKTLHAVLSYMFEKCSEWEKGHPYPKFKIINTFPDKIILSTELELQENSFSFTYGKGNLKTDVFIEKITNVFYNFKHGQKVLAFGRLSMYKNKKDGDRRSKVAHVRSKYKNLILDPEEFKNIIESKTGIDIDSISVDPLYISKELMPNSKAINSAFDISIVGSVKDENIINSLSYSSVGQDLSYGFGAFHIKEL